MILRRIRSALGLMFLLCGLQGCLYVELYGPVTNATVTITPLRGGPALVSDARSYSIEKTRGLFSVSQWFDMDEGTRLSLMAAVDLPKKQLVDDRYYLVTADGGLDWDYNIDGRVDFRGEPILGSWHAILTGKQLKGVTRISVLTEAVYQYLRPVLDAMDDEELAAALDEVAARIVTDIDGNGSTDYTDIVLWSATAYTENYRGNEFLMERVRYDVEFDLGDETTELDAVQLIERAAWTPAVAQSPYADDLVFCVSPIYVPELCNMLEFPLIGQEAAQPTVADMMNRVVVSHPWMAERFEQMLEAMPQMLFTLARSVSAVIIADTIRPAYFDPVTNAVYLDPDFFWLTGDELDTVSDEADYRAAFASNVAFTDFARFVSENRSIYNYDLNDDGSRTLEQALPAAASLLFHEFAHAADSVPSSTFPTLDLRLSPFQQTHALASDTLINALPLREARLFGVADVLYGGTDPTPMQANYAPEDIGDLFVEDRANDLYSYFTQFEDLAMLVEEFMMATYFHTNRDIAFTTVPEDGTEEVFCDDYRIGWGLRNRISTPEVRARLEVVLSELLPTVNFSEELAALPATKSLPSGVGWCEYLDQLAGNGTLAERANAARRPVPPRRRRYE